MEPMRQIDNIIYTVEIEEKLAVMLGEYAEKIPALSTMRGHRQVVKSIMNHLVDTKVLDPIRPEKKEPDEEVRENLRQQILKNTKSF